MRKLKFNIPTEAQPRIVYGLGTQYSNPLHALREYLTNALDAVDDARSEGQQRGLVKTLIVPEDKRIIVYDNGPGMDGKKLESLPNNIGLSAKFDRIDQRGEKAVGLLSFASMGSGIHIVSKKENEREYGYLRYAVNKDKLEPVIDTLSHTEVRVSFYGTFRHGTRIIIDTNPQILGKNLTLDLVKDFIQQTYLPLLKRREIEIQIESSKNGLSEKIFSPLMGQNRGNVKLLDENIGFQAKRTRETEDYNLFAFLFFDPEMDDGQIGVYSKDVRVYESALQLEESLRKLEFWNCRQIGGFLNEPNLRLTLGRDGINRNTKAYQGLISKLEEIHEKFWPQIKGRIQQRKEDRGAKVVRDSWKEFQRAYQDTEPLDKQKRARNPNPDPKPDPDQNPDPKPGPKPPRKRKRKLNFGQPHVHGFDLKDKDLRSRLENPMGQPVVGINSDHDDYRIFVLEEKDPKKQREYIFEIAAHPIAEHEARNEIEKRGGSLGDPFQMATLMERRAQDLNFSILKRKRKLGKR